MSASWAAIFTDTGDEPVRGRPQEFHDAAEQFRELQDRAQEVAGEFTRIRDGSAAGQFAGEAAEAFKAVLADVDQAVQHLPRVASGIRATFASHAQELEILRRRSAEALARAQTNWRSAGTAQCELDQGRARRASILDQIKALEATPSAATPETEIQLDRKREELRWVTGRIEDSEQELRTAENGLHDAKAEWHNLRRGEEDLDARTAKALRTQALWSLGDPSMAEQLGAAGAQLLKDYYDFTVQAVLDSARNLVELLVTGDLLWAIYEALEVFLAIGQWVLPLLGPKGWLVLVVLASVKLLFDSFLLGSVHPITKKPFTGFDLLVDAAALISALFGLRGATAAAFARNLAYSGAPSSTFVPIDVQAARLSAIGKGINIFATISGLVDYNIEKPITHDTNPSEFRIWSFRTTGIPRAIDVCRGSDADALRAGFVRIAPAVAP